MILRFFLFSILLLNSSSNYAASDSSWLAIPFYSEIIQMPASMAPTPTPAMQQVSEEGLVDWYHLQGSSSQWQDLLGRLQGLKQRLGLNDWLYYELIRQTAQQLAPDNLLGERLYCWFLLSESGYDTRLTFLEEQIFLYAYTEDGIFDTPMIMDNGRRYVNLSSIHQNMQDPAVSLSLLRYDANARGHGFSFRLEQWPQLRPDLQAQQVAFNWRGKPYKLNLELDRNAAAIMQHYPIFEEYRYLEVPLSPTLARSLLPQLKDMLVDKNARESLEILVAFTRSAFQYREDRDHFGKNKPMIADELFHYPYSDCEDRSALFYNLVRQLLDLPMIAIAYPDHLTIAVALDQAVGPAIRYEGRRYYICDPTGPNNSDQIGQIPEGYEDISFEILGKYK